MSEEREERVRKALDELARHDPSLAIDREQTVKEVAAGLEKVETAWGGPGSTGPGIWELAKAPFTGRLHGIEVERGLWPWAMIILRLAGAVVGPIFGAIQWVGFWRLSRTGQDARVTDQGVEVFTKTKGHIATYPWDTISQLRLTFSPPLTLWELVLSSGEVVSLPCAQIDPSTFEQRGIEVDAEARIRPTQS